MKVYVVGHDGPEHNEIISIHKTYDSAFAACNRVRMNLIKECKDFIQIEQKEKEVDKSWVNLLKEQIKNLSCEDPAQISNYPHKTPYIDEMELEDEK